MDTDAMVKPKTHDIDKNAEVNPTSIFDHAVDTYIKNQAENLLSSIFSWFTRTKWNLLFKEQVFSCGHQTTTTETNVDRKKDLLTLEYIINCQTKFFLLKMQHESLEQNNKFIEVSNKLIDTNNILHLAPRLITPTVLQSEIYQMTNHVSNTLTEIDMKRVVEFNHATKCNSHDQLSKAIAHPDTKHYNQQPTELNKRIECLKQRFSQHEAQQLYYCQSLEISLDFLHKILILCDFNSVLEARIDRANKDNENTTLFYKKTQDEYKSHPLFKTAFTSGVTLSSILEDIKLSHNIQTLHIHFSNLSKKQKTTLLSLTRNVIPMETQPNSESCIDMIRGRIDKTSKNIKKIKTEDQKTPKSTTKRKEKEKEKSKKLASKMNDMQNQRVLTDHFTHEKTFKFHCSYCDGIIDKQTERVNLLSSKLNKLIKVYQQNIKEIENNKKIIDGRFGLYQRETIIIDGQLFCYLDALTAYNRITNPDLAVNATIKEHHSYSKIITCQKEIQHKKAMDASNNEALSLAMRCYEMKLDPSILPKMVEMSILESMPNYTNIEQFIRETNLAIREHQEQINKCDLLIKSEVAKHSKCTKKRLNDQIASTRQSQFLLFKEAFQCGKHLSKANYVKHLACKYLKHNMTPEKITTESIQDMDFHDSSENPTVELSYDWDISNPKWSTASTIFTVINVKGAYPLLNALNNSQPIGTPYFLLLQDEKGKLSSALILAAAMNRYKSCEAIMRIAGKSNHLEISYIHQLLTVSSTPDKRNLMHHIANMDKPSTMQAMLIFLANVSIKQDHDDDYPATSLQNQVAEDQ